MYGVTFSNVMEDYFVLYTESSGGKSIYKMKKSAQLNAFHFKMIFW